MLGEGGVSYRPLLCPIRGWVLLCIIISYVGTVSTGRDIRGEYSSSDFITHYGSYRSGGLNTKPV